jgi:hypothetical protein
MRRASIWVALTLTLGLAGPAFAQSGSAFRTISPGEMSFQPVDLSHVAAPIQTVPTQSAWSRFVSGIHMPSIFSSAPKLGGAPLSPQSKLPSTTTPRGQLTPVLPITGH